MSEHHQIPCSSCLGSGHTACIHCSGTGYVLGFHGGEEACSTCNGAGQEICSECHGSAMLASSPMAEPASGPHQDVRFGAGVCSHCGGRGYTTYPSSGSQTSCWYCGGSGVAH